MIIENITNRFMWSNRQSLNHCYVGRYVIYWILLSFGQCYQFGSTPKWSHQAASTVRTFIVTNSLLVATKQNFSLGEISLQSVYFFSGDMEQILPNKISFQLYRIRSWISFVYFENIECVKFLQSHPPITETLRFWEGVGTSNFRTSTGQKFQNVEMVFLVDQNVKSQKDQNVKSDLPMAFCLLNLT